MNVLEYIYIYNVSFSFSSFRRIKKNISCIATIVFVFVLFSSSGGLKKGEGVNRKRSYE